MKSRLLQRAVLAGALVLVLAMSSSASASGSTRHERNQPSAAVAVAPVAADQPMPTPDSSMQQRVDEIILILKSNPSCSTAQGALEHLIEVWSGGFVVEPTKGDALQQTTQANLVTRQNAMRIVDALQAYISAAGPDCAAKRLAVDIKIFIEELDEVMVAAGQVTIRCGLNDICPPLQPLLDEATGAVAAVAATPARLGPIVPGFVVKLRSPFMPTNFTGNEEEMVVTPALSRGQCAAVVKETRGLMVLLRFDGIIIVTDPWVSTFGVPRGTVVPVWRLEWVPAEFIKEVDICNTAQGIVKTVTQRVVQDTALDFFWRYFPKN